MVKILKSIQIISKYYKYPIWRLNEGQYEFKSNIFLAKYGH
jgi:hypothetical protein